MTKDEKVYICKNGERILASTPKDVRLGIASAMQDGHPFSVEVENHFARVVTVSSFNPKKKIRTVLTHRLD